MFTVLGQVITSINVYIFSFMLMSLLVAIFINRYRAVWENIAAIRRMDFINLKNIKAFDPNVGGVTMTFFPINILLFPFILPVIGFKSSRLSDFILKI